MECSCRCGFYCNCCRRRALCTCILGYVNNSLRDVRRPSWILNFKRKSLEKLCMDLVVEMWRNLFCPELFNLFALSYLPNDGCKHILINHLSFQIDLEWLSGGGCATMFCYQIDISLNSYSNSCLGKSLKYGITISHLKYKSQATKLQIKYIDE